MEEFRLVALSDCYESPLNTRRHFDKARLKELTESVAAKGVLTPILVREREAAGGRFEILAGARRCRAARAAQIAQVPAVIRTFSDDEALEVVVIENLQRDDVSPLEEAEGYRALLERPGYDVAAIAAKISKAESYVYGRLKLCELIKPAKEALTAEQITAGHALLLARLQPADQKEALEHCFDRRLRDGGKDKDVLVTASVRSLAAWIYSNLQLDLAHAPFAPGDAELVPAAGSCTTCPKRSGFAPALFPDIAKKDICTDRACFKAKLGAHLAQTKARLKAEGGPVVELSTSYSYDKKAGPLSSNRWTEIKRGQKKCDHATTGLVTAGDRDIGKVLTVCAADKCKEHRGSGGMHSTTASPAEKARRAKVQEQQLRDAALRRRLFGAVHAAAPATLSRIELDRLVQGYIAEMQQDSVRLLVQALELITTKKKRSYGGGSHVDWQDTLSIWAGELDDTGVTRLLIILPLVTGLEGHEWGRPERKGLLRKAAELYGVDVKAIEKAIADESRERAAKKLARTSKAKTKATKRATAKKCEKCGCTEAAACPDGCAWDPTFQRKGRWVCTTPACVKSATARGARKAKKAAPATAKKAKRAKKKAAAQ